MRIEYPEYYNRFRCIADRCPDTCCAGWEVDVDEDTYYYYQVVPGAFGERLRASMAEDGEGHWFPLTCDNRCPFLNDRNLCDIYANLGEESLSRVCTEYPRYYMEIGDYEQIDMSLSCMELGRILFTETPEITYISEQNDAVPEEELTPEDAARLDQILRQRNAVIESLQSGEGTVWERLRRAGIAIGGLPVTVVTETRACPHTVARTGQADRADMAGETGSDTCPEDDEALLAVLDQFEAINDGWYETLASLHTRPEPVMFNRKDEYFTKLALYLVYRYSIDSYLDGEDHIGERTIRLITRSLRILDLMCAIRYAANGNTFSVEDMIDIAHRFSKEVEHSDDNIEMIKQA